MFAYFSVDLKYNSSQAMQRAVAVRIGLILYGDVALKAQPIQDDGGRWQINPMHNDWWLHPPMTAKNSSPNLWRLDSRYSINLCMEISAILPKLLA